MSKRTLLEALLSEDPPPCLEFDCKFENACAENKLACEAFHHYVSTGIAEHPASYWIKGEHFYEDDYYPTALRYAMVYRPDPNMKPRKQIPDLMEPRPPKPKSKKSR